jgi:hypothetical protein
MQIQIYANSKRETQHRQTFYVAFQFTFIFHQIAKMPYTPKIEVENLLFNVELSVNYELKALKQIESKTRFKIAVKLKKTMNPLGIGKTLK